MLQWWSDTSEVIMNLCFLPASFMTFNSAGLSSTLPPHWLLAGRPLVALVRSFLEPAFQYVMFLLARIDLARAAAVVLEFPSLKLVEQAVAEIPVPFPYVPGLLSFREQNMNSAVVEQFFAAFDAFVPGTGG